MKIFKSNARSLAISKDRPSLSDDESPSVFSIESQDISGLNILSSDAGVSCPSNCRQRNIPKHALAMHLIEHCDRRIIECSHCFHQMEKRAEVDHFKLCEKMPVDCPNDCGVGKI